MSKNNDPLKFILNFESPDDPRPGYYIQCGLAYNLKLIIESVKSPTFSHRGIEYEFCTEICNFDGTVVKYNVTSRHLADSAVINNSVIYDLPQVKTMANGQTYHGALFAVRHMIRVWVKKFFGMETLEREILAFKKVQYPKRVEPYNWAMIIDDTFRINILMQRRKFDLDDVILGELHFIIANMKIRMVRIQLVAQETLEFNGVSKKFKNVIDYWELAVGNPVKGEMIPFRIFLKPVYIWPSTSNVELGYSSTHFVHFTVITESGSKYFKALQVRFTKMDRLPFFFEGEDDALLSQFQKDSPTNSSAPKSKKLFSNEKSDDQEEGEGGNENDGGNENGDADDNDDDEIDDDDNDDDEDDEM